VLNSFMPTDTFLGIWSPRISKRPGVVVHACHPSYTRGGDKRMVSSRTAQAKLARPCLKDKIQMKVLGGIAQVAAYLLSIA
jgi:hypothetical protein